MEPLPLCGPTIQSYSINRISKILRLDIYGIGTLRGLQRSAASGTTSGHTHIEMPNPDTEIFH